MALNPIPILRIVQGVLTLIVLGVDAYVVDFYNSNHRSSPSEANFIIWSCVWSFLTLLYLFIAPNLAPNFHNKWTVLGVESITVIFWFAGWIAMASFCGSLSLCYGTVCGCARAAVVFSVFVWIAWCISLYVVVRAIITWNAQQAQDVESGMAPAGEKGEGNIGASYPVPVGNHSQFPQQQHQIPGSEDTNDVVDAHSEQDDPNIHYAHPSPPPPAAGGFRMPNASAFGGRG